MHATLKSGFTLVELVLVLVIIGLLSAVAIPRYIEKNNERQLAEKQHVSSSVKTALIVAQADTNQPPSVATLASYVQAEKASASEAGVIMLHNGESYIVPTYVDSKCINPTHAASDTVACVGDVP